MKMEWNSNLAKLWSRIVGPSRPSVSELNVFTKYVHRLLNHRKKRLRLLVLGSTPEYRDWGFEENMIVSVVDYSKSYHQSINNEIRHKSIIDGTQGKEEVCFYSWQELDEVNKYDIIIGDLVVGNIAPQDLDNFFFKVMNALTSNGLFLGKSFFVPENCIKKTPEELVLEYYNGPQYHPYSALVFGLTMYCIDENNMLNFNTQYKELEKLYNNKILKEETFAYFKNIGWDNEMKFRFHCPFLRDYEALVNKYFKIVAIERGLDIYSKDFPLHIITHKNSTIYGD